MCLSRLTPRERVIADRLLADDAPSIVSVARELGAPVATIRSHVQNIALKLANPFQLPALKLIRSYAPAAAAARVETPPPPPVENRAAAYWARAAAHRPP